MKPVLKLRADLCESCIFRPGNPMSLRPGRVRDMVEESRRNDAHIVCHETLEYYDGPLSGENAACRGFVEAGNSSQALQVAERLGLLEEIP